MIFFLKYGLVFKKWTHTEGQDRRDGYVRARLHNREQMPVLGTKKDILPMF